MKQLMSTILLTLTLLVSNAFAIGPDDTVRKVDEIQTRSNALLLQALNLNLNDSGSVFSDTDYFYLQATAKEGTDELVGSGYGTVIRTTNQSTLDSGPIFVRTGNSTSGDSGPVILRAGNAPSGTRGSVEVLASILNLNGSRISNVADPVDAQDAATRQWTIDQITAMGGVEDLNDLSDVTITTPADGEILVYDTGVFVNQAPAFANQTLSNLTTTAINTSLISDTDNTDDLGSSAINWKDLYLSGSAIFDGGSIGIGSGQFVNESVGIPYVINSDTSFALSAPTMTFTGASSFSGNINMLGNGITSLVDPTNDQDAATKKYVDDQIALVDEVNNFRVEDQLAIADGSPVELPDTAESMVVRVAGDDLGAVTADCIAIGAGSAGTPGQIVKLVGTGTTDPFIVTLEDSRATTNGCVLNGRAVLSEYRVIELMFINARWVEMSRNF